MFNFLTSWTKVIRFGYRQKFRSHVLFEIPFHTIDHRCEMVDQFRQALATACGKTTPDNHECYALMWTSDTITAKGPVYVSFSDGICFVHLDAPNQDGGTPTGDTNALALYHKLIETS
jgi:hypothetical protein